MPFSLSFDRNRSFISLNLSGVRYIDLPIARGHDGFQVLAAHHGADAASAGGPEVLVYDTRKLAQALASGANARDAQVFIVQVFLQAFRGLAGRLTPIY